MRAEDSRDHVSKVIFEYAARIGQEREPDNLLRLNADMARDLVGADRCSIWLLDSAANQLHTKVAHGVGELRVDRGHGLVGACVTQNQPIVVNDTAADERFLNRIDTASGYVTNSVLVIPLRAADGSVIGAFQALNKAGGFADADVSLLGLAASYSASALETQKLRSQAEEARLIRRELEIARDVQASLVPQVPPELERLECASFFRPAKFVGGDYYDFIPTPDGGLAFTIGDVSGKGIPAAVLMASIQASLRIPLRRGPESLGGLVRDLNQSVLASFPETHYSTLFCGLIDASRRNLRFINAGQCRPMLVRKGESETLIERLKTTGMPIGMLPEADYSEASIPLEPGDLLVCYSDGISEARNGAKEIWDESEIESILSTAEDLSARAVTDLVVRGADAFTNNAEQADDMTVVTLRVY